MPDEIFRGVETLACTEGENEMVCEIETDDGTQGVSVSVVTTSDLHPYAISKFSQDSYDQVREQEYQIEFIGKGTCSLDTNPKGNPALSCRGNAADF